jgi:NCAIR mutase (PurE)-related protein
VRRDLLDELREERRREERAILGCAGGAALLLLVLVAVIFIGCPAAVSYGVSRGCAAGAEHAR